MNITFHYRGRRYEVVIDTSRRKILHVYALDCTPVHEIEPTCHMCDTFWHNYKN